jgi:hypothetical protein
MMTSGTREASSVWSSLEGVTAAGTEFIGREL